MNSENQKKILDAVSQVFRGIASALGRDSHSCEESYAEGIRFICNHGQKTLFELLLEIIKRTLPVTGREQNLIPEAIPAFLNVIDTWEKAETFLGHIPDPDPAKLDKILREVLFLLPSIRKVLIPFAKQLPPDPGGHPRKISEQEEPIVRAEVAQLFNDGYSFPDAKKEVARRRRASLSTIQRICRKGTIQIVGAGI